MRGKDFRAGVGAVIINRDGLIFAGERIAEPGNWQMPQGGLNADEAPLTGLYREVWEETAISPDLLHLLEEYPGWLSYELPDDFNMRRQYRGQTQKWYLLRFAGASEDVSLEKAIDKEFRDWKWISADHLLNGIVAFKRPVYRQLFQRFSEHLEMGESL